LRPHVGRDKDEIVKEARHIGTYDISIEPDQDCCTLFVPQHPATRSALGDVERAEAALDVDALVAAALQQTETLVFRWPESAP
jgi:thiamine biosynthesis protein ThiI